MLPRCSPRRASAANTRRPLHSALLRGREHCTESLLGMPAVSDPADVGFRYEHSGRGEPEIRDCLGRRLARPTQVRVQLAQPAVADFLIDTGVAAGGSGTAAFFIFGKKPNPCC
ncbi:hypothetical protein GCM10008097_26880 [Mycetocola manganoxydans]|nr:hypothetical protein GCM10008097_26880 [Mycetocola manganoxydans]